jgi:MarR family 2-MHQ and catechol resistance regulon transcriptional repressor
MKTTKKYGKKADLALSMWVKLARASSTFGKRSEDNIRSFGLTPSQFAVLESLGHLGPMIISDLCEKMLVTGGNMTVVIDNLERDELVERVRSEDDRRAIMIQLTTKGKKLFENIFPKHAEWIGKLASVLSEHEQEELSRLLKKLGFGVREIS